MLRPKLRGSGALRRLWALQMQRRQHLQPNAVTADRSVVMMESSRQEGNRAGISSSGGCLIETQSEFAQTLQAKFGSEFVWNSANLNAFSKLAIPSADREVILKQWESAVNIRYTPASYMLERSLSDAWYQVTQRQGFCTDRAERGGNHR